MRVNNAYEGCAACLGGGGGSGEEGGGGGGTSPCELYPPGHPARPWWCDPPPLPPERYFPLYDCETGAKSNYYLRGDHVEAVINGILYTGQVFEITIVGVARCYRLGVPMPAATASGAAGAGSSPRRNGCLLSSSDG